MCFTLDVPTKVIHAVGPVYRLRFGVEPGSVDAETFLASRDADLTAAYKRALEVANELGVCTLAFSLLSASVFRGEKPLEQVLEIGLRAIQQFARTKSSVVRVHMVAWTDQEQQALKQVFDRNSIETKE